MQGLELIHKIGRRDIRERPGELHTPVTASFDIRYSGYKMAPVDANLFPAGWHQLCSGAQVLAAERLRDWIVHRNIDGPLLLFAEPFTRNPAYLESLWQLHQIVSKATGRCEIVMPLSALPDGGHTFTTVHGVLQVYRFDKPQDHQPRLQDGTVAAGVLLNSDLSNGDEQLTQCTSPVFPAPVYGWHQRHKETFFRHWSNIAREFARSVDLDPWHLDLESATLDIPDLREGQGELADQITDMLGRIAVEYRSRNISDQPFVVLKDAAGTFGRGVLVLADAAELQTLSKKVLKNMNKGQRGRSVGSFLLQEGIYTREIVRDCPSEPVIYAAGGAVIGGFYRSHCGKDPATSLNAPGMVFASMCVAGGHKTAAEKCHTDPLAQGAYYQLGCQALRALDSEIKAV